MTGAIGGFYAEFQIIFGTAHINLLLNSIFSTILLPPANYWVGRYIYYDSDNKDIEYSNINA